jgi:hypothetical protein
MGFHMDFSGALPGPGQVKGMVFELVVQGAGVTLVDSTSLNEVAYLCADTLVPYRSERALSWPVCFASLV